MKIGFLGVGNIATCMIEGFYGLGQQHDFFLSPRNVARSAEFAAKYTNVTVCASNQHVVNTTDIVFLTMNSRDKDCVEALRSLNFRVDQHIVNVIATTPPEDVREAIGTVGGFSQIIPLPSVRHRYGPIAAYPESAWLEELMSPLGTVVFAKTLDDIRTMQALTALIATFYDTLHNLTIFAENEGLGRKEAITFISAFYASLCKNVLDADFDELIGEMTPGGLNMMAQGILNEKGAVKAWGDVLTPVIERIRG